MSPKYAGRLGQRWAVVAAIITVAIVCGFSHRAARPSDGYSAQPDRIDPLGGDLKDQWFVYGDLSPSEVTLDPMGSESANLAFHPSTAAWSSSDSGVAYITGLSSPGWYEFTAELSSMRSAANDVGVQIDLSSDKWRFSAKSRPSDGANWRTIDIYFRPADYDPMLEISFRFLGGPMDHIVTISLRNMRILKVAGSPPPHKARFDMQEKEQALWKPVVKQTSGPAGSTVILTVVVLVAAAAACWRRD